MSAEALAAPIIKDYPAGITDTPFELDGVVFSPSPDGRFEHAMRDGNHVGDVLHDDDRLWFARKWIDGELTDWQPMRCVYEARAFLVSQKPPVPA